MICSILRQICLSNQLKDVQYSTLLFLQACSAVCADHINDTVPETQSLIMIIHILHNFSKNYSEISSLQLADIKISAAMSE